MAAPRLQIDLAKIEHNASVLVERLAARGIAVTGITKAMLGAPQLAQALVRAGVTRLGDSHIESIEAMRAAGVVASMILIRTPMLSQVDRVVASADMSCNTEPVVLAGLSTAARTQGRVHGIILMVELGDLREGILPADLDAVARQVVQLPGLALEGIGTNLACHSGVAPNTATMAELSALASALEAALGVGLARVSGGNSANLTWALGDHAPGRIDDLRLGESILLGREPLHRMPIEGLHTDATTLAVEVIEAKVKPSQPWGELGQTAFGLKPRAPDRGPVRQAILAVGRQDTDPSGLCPPVGVTVLGSSSDHLVVDSGDELLVVGSEVVFGVDYSALARAMASPYVACAWA